MSEISYSTIAATGPDAFAFLQAQLTVDLAAFKARPETEQLRSAWCNPKGRVICMPGITAIDNGYALTLPASLAETVVQRLTMFRFRARIEFGISAAAPVQQVARIEKLRAGIVEIELAQSEKFTPHMLNLDLLHIINLDKGCYPGQEIVARTHYRGKTKRRCLHFESLEPVNPGDKVRDCDRDVGEVVNAEGIDLLAVVPLDAAERELFIGDKTISRRELPYSV